MRVGFFTFEQFHGKHDIGSSRIRAEWVAKYWEGAELFRYAQPYDVVIYQKVYALEHAQQFDGVKILDLCDPDWIGGQAVVEMASYCDAITTSTVALRDYIARYVTIPVVFIPDCIDFEENHQQKTTHAERITKAIWHGYSHNAKALQGIYASCQRRGIELTVVSDTTVQDCDQWIKYDRDTINDEIVAADVAILPPAGGVIGSFKSDNKTVNAWSLGVPVVCFADFNAVNEQKYGELAHLTFDALATAEQRAIEAKLRRDYVLGERNAAKVHTQYETLIGQLHASS